MKALLPAVLALLVFLPALGCASTTIAPMGRDTVPLAVVPAPAVPAGVVSSRTCSYGDKDACITACEAGDAPSCDNLGAMYEAGLVLPHDDDRASALYTRACLGGAAAGCSNSRRLAAAEAAAVSPPAAIAAVTPPPAPPPPAVAAPDPPPPAPVATATCTGADDCRAQCEKGNEDACRDLPGIHISGNVQIYGNVKIFGEVFMDGAKKD